MFFSPRSHIQGGTGHLVFKTLTVFRPILSAFLFSTHALCRHVLGHQGAYGRQERDMFNVRAI